MTCDARPTTTPGDGSSDSGTPGRFSVARGRARPRMRQDTSTPRAARLVAAAIRTGRFPANQAFDRFLPRELREVSDRYWTPLPVVRRAALWLRDARVRTVVDIGSGAGKFCVATALLAPFSLIGLEHRSSLIASARGLAELFEVDDRVTFVQGEFGVGPTPIGDAY